MSIYEPVIEVHPDAHVALEQLCAATRAELGRAGAVEYRAAALHALLCAYNHRFLVEATADLRSAVEALTAAGAARAGAVAAVAPYLRRSPDATLRELSAACPEPYRGELEALREGLAATSTRIGELETKNVETLGAQMALVDEVLSGLGSDADFVYGRELPSAPRVLRGVW